MKSDSSQKFLLELWKSAVRARSQAYAPYSNYKVGAALRTEDGEIFTGCNVENSSFGAGLCAERVALFKAVSEGKKKFSQLVVVVGSDPVPPCALCLQVLAEFCGPDLEIWTASPEAPSEKFRFIELLPKPFGPRDFG